MKHKISDLDWKRYRQEAAMWKLADRVIEQLTVEQGPGQLDFSQMRDRKLKHLVPKLQARDTSVLEIEEGPIRSVRKRK